MQVFLLHAGLHFVFVHITSSWVVRWRKRFVCEPAAEGAGGPKAEWGKNCEASGSHPLAARERHSRTLDAREILDAVAIRY